MALPAARTLQHGDRIFTSPLGLGWARWARCDLVDASGRRPQVAVEAVPSGVAAVVLSLAPGWLILFVMTPVRWSW
jgi:hypothetical protein